MEVGGQDVQGIPLLAQPSPRQSYAPMNGKPVPSNQEPWRDLWAEHQARREGAHGWEKLEPLHVNPKGTHVHWAWRNIQRLNKTQVPNVRRQHPINACFASGGWVPMGQGAVTAIHPKVDEHPQAYQPATQPQAPPRPVPHYSTRHTEARSPVEVKWTNPPKNK